MPKKLTTEEFIKRFRDKYGDNFTVMSNYISYQKNVTIKCNICGKTFQMTPNNLFKKNFICDCQYHNKNKSKAYTNDEFLKLAIERHGDEFDLSKVNYINRATPIIVGCKKHGFFEVLPYNFLKFRGCHQCALEEHIDSKKLTNEDFIKRAKIIHGDRYEYLSDYVNMQEKIKIKCTKCGEIFFQTPHHHLNGKQGCPKCKKWKLEESIKNILKTNNIHFIHQYKTTWLGLQSLDFYIPDVKVAIECQGRQHFVGWGNNIQSLEEQKKRDLKKKQLCEENGIKLLYFSDTKYNDDIFIDEEILLKEISS